MCNACLVLYAIPINGTGANGLEGFRLMVVVAFLLFFLTFILVKESGVAWRATSFLSVYVSLLVV